MKERPIPMNGPMVRAILSGAKTQTRRPVAPLLFIETTNPDRIVEQSSPDFGAALMQWGRCPYGAPGDRLWCRERARVLDYSTGPVADGVTGTLARLRYEADGAEAWVPFPSRLWTVTEGHCVPNGVFREGARLSLDVVDVRVDRLHDISEEDARAEGVREVEPGKWACYLGGKTESGEHADASHSCYGCYSAKASFQTLWESINGAESWDANPWVWCVGFRRLP